MTPSMPADDYRGVLPPHPAETRAMVEQALAALDRAEQAATALRLAQLREYAERRAVLERALKDLDGRPA